MKTLLASLMLLNVACTNAEYIPASADYTEYKPYEQPMPELPIEIRMSVPNAVHDIIHWDKLSSDYYSEDEA